MRNNSLTFNQKALEEAIRDSKPLSEVPLGSSQTHRTLVKEDAVTDNGHHATKKTKTFRQKTIAPKVTAPEAPALYERDELETAEDEERYRKELKKHIGVYKALFSQVASSEEIKRLGQSIVIGLPTFDAHAQVKDIVTYKGLTKMVQTLGMDDSGNVKALREHITMLIKVINQSLSRKNNDAFTRMGELNFEGFLEFVLQLSHQCFNSLVEEDQSAYFELKSYQLQQKFFAKLRDARKEYQFPKKYFEAADHEHETNMQICFEILDDLVWDQF